MLHVLHRLQRIWYMILFIATICLVADVTLFSTYTGGNDIFFPLPLFADIPTVLIFAYALWGKSQPFLLPTASPKSNPCTRGTRIVGTLFLACLWLMNTVIYGLSMSIGRHVLAAFTAFETILILLEMVVSHKVGKAQRRILKEELRRQKGEEEVVAAAAFPSQGRARSETGQDDLSVEPTTLESTSSSRPEQTTQNWDPLVDSERANNHASESNGQQGPRREGTDSAVEIVRPAEVDPSAILLSQQLMYEAFQRQQKQQFQLFFMAQQQLQTQSPSANALMELKGDDDDDIPVLLSQKIEIPSDHAKDATSLVSVTVFPPFSNSAGTQYLHVPSAPPKSAFSQDTPKSIQYQTQQYGIEKTPFPLTGEDDKKQVVVEPCIPVMVSMDIVQSKASAPPLEPQVLLDPPIPSLTPAPCVELATYSQPKTNSPQAPSPDPPKEEECIPEESQQPIKDYSIPPPFTSSELLPNEAVIHMSVQEIIAIVNEPVEYESANKRKES